MALALLAPDSAAAQRGGELLAAAYGGVGIDGGGRTASGSITAEIRAPSTGRISPAVSVSYWSFSAGCDLIVGAPCDDAGWSADLGAVVRVTRGSSWIKLGLAARVGRLYYRHWDRGVWDPSLGVTADGTLRGRLGWQVDLTYHALMDNRPSTQAYRPNSTDQVVLRTGIHFRR